MFEKVSENLDFELELQKIKERNKRVEADKAWEVSPTRRLFIASITYVVAVLWLSMIGDSDTWIKALLPVFGYLVSTFSLPLIKDWWVKKRMRDS